jgi:putative Ca2+/H+ antiporter (TMEM165/GDT1 family)
MSIKFLTWLTTYILIVLAELGDKTQVAVLLITSNNPTRRWLVLGASCLALILCVTVEVTVGVVLARYIGPAIINRVAGVIFLLLGIATLMQTLDISDRIHLRKSEPACVEER